MRFKVYGPYDIGVGEGLRGWIDEEDTEDFWANVVGDKLSKACGVYLFGIHGRKKYKTAEEKLPWYAGKAERRTFRAECFTHRNLFYFNRVFFKEYQGKGKPFLYLLARVEGEHDEFSKPANDKQQYWGLQFVEKMFIQLSLSANNGLINKSMTKRMKETSIRGLLNTKKHPSSSVDKLKSVFGIKHEPAEVADYKGTNFRYDVHGPYPIKKATNKAIDSEDIEGMWKAVREDRKAKYSIPDTCGVYVIGMQNGGNTKPWYVGAAHRTFAAKCFESHLEREKVVNRNGRPVIYFLPRLIKKKEEFVLAKSTAKPPADMDYVKDVLLEYGVQENKDILLEDDYNAKTLRDLYVEGFVNAEKGDGKKKIVQGLRQILGFKKK